MRIKSFMLVCFLFVSVISKSNAFANPKQPELESKAIVSLRETFTPILISLMKNKNIKRFLLVFAFLVSFNFYLYAAISGTIFTTTNKLYQLIQQQRIPVFNIFLIETNRYPDRSIFDFKQLCSVESAAFNNPNALIHFYTLHSSAQLNKDILNKYENIKTIHFTVDQEFQNTSFADWWSKNQELVLKSKFGMVHVSDALRLALVFKYGGIYMDLDTITIKDLEPLINYPGSGYEDPNKLCGTVLNFPKGHQLMAEIIEKFIKNYNINCYSCNGPVLLTGTIKSFCQIDQLNLLNLDNMINQQSNLVFFLS